MTEYPWILLQNLNDGLLLIWLALLIVTSAAGMGFLTESPWDCEKPHWQGYLVQKRRWFQGMLVLLLLLGTVLVILPGKEQMALLRGEEEGKGCGTTEEPSSDDHVPQKKVHKEMTPHRTVSVCV